ncbi:MAG TPA: YfiR family protein [Candidatus Acidoferrum sp.]|nr:YfiR family protein [Candidatus Acidoferrum sp.]
MTKATTQVGGRGYARGRRAVLVLALLHGILSGVLDCQTSSQMSHAEAVYLRKILVFVQWPPRPGIPNEVFRVCVAGRYGIGFVLAEELRASTVDGQKIDVRMLPKDQGLMNCQVLFISEPDVKQRAKLLESVKGTHVLTVADDKGFLEAGGILEFSSVGNVMQFAVNLPAAKSAGLKIDARLLSLARRVVTEKGATGS